MSKYSSLLRTSNALPKYVDKMVSVVSGAGAYVRSVNPNLWREALHQGLVWVESLPSSQSVASSPKKSVGAGVKDVPDNLLTACEAAQTEQRAALP